MKIWLSKYEYLLAPRFVTVYAGLPEQHSPVSVICHSQTGVGVSVSFHKFKSSFLNALHRVSFEPSLESKESMLESVSMALQSISQRSFRTMLAIVNYFNTAASCRF